MRITIHKSLEGAVNGSAIVMPIFADKKIGYVSSVLKDKRNIEVIKGAVDCFDFGLRDTKAIYLPNKEDGRGATVVLVGLGERKAWSVKKFVLAMRRIVHAAKVEKIKSIAILFDGFNLPVDLERAAELAGANLMMADYDFNKYKEAPKGGWPRVDDVRIIAAKMSKSVESGLREGVALGEEINSCRNLANTPGGDMTPSLLAEHAVAEGVKNNFKVSILEEKEMKALGMGGVLGVARGSTEKPKFIIIEYHGAAKSKQPILFAGKGVTFDSGGLNLKPSDGIYEMHMDMSGGAAVIHAISAIARNKLKVNVVGLIPAVENMPSGSSYRPGDLLRAMNGKTIEVMNTDAEGRVILADALAYASKFKPELVVDVATLTGAAMVALGQRAIALFSNSVKLQQKIQNIGEKIVEPVWPLPLWDEYIDEIRGTFGDFANVGRNKYGGAINGAMFLKQFIGDYPWAHLDIAPTMTSIDGQYLAKGSSGAGVRILYELAKQAK